MTTIGWELQCEMSDGTRQWFPLKDVKESNPVEAAKNAVATMHLHGGSRTHCTSGIASLKRCDRSTGNVPTNMVLSYLAVLMKH